MVAESFLGWVPARYLSPRKLEQSFQNRSKMDPLILPTGVQAILTPQPAVAAVMPYQTRPNPKLPSLGKPQVHNGLWADSARRSEIAWQPLTWRGVAAKYLENRTHDPSRLGRGSLRDLVNRIRRVLIDDRKFKWGPRGD